jgi:hypothetical protein
MNLETKSETFRQDPDFDCVLLLPQSFRGEHQQLWVDDGDVVQGDDNRIYATEDTHRVTVRGNHNIIWGTKNVAIRGDYNILLMDSSAESAVSKTDYEAVVHVEGNGNRIIREIFSRPLKNWCIMGHDNQQWTAAEWQADRDNKNQTLANVSRATCSTSSVQDLTLSISSCASCDSPFKKESHFSIQRPVFMWHSAGGAAPSSHSSTPPWLQDAFKGSTVTVMEEPSDEQLKLIQDTPASPRVGECCILCTANMPRVVLLPCKHSCYCGKCFLEIRKNRNRASYSGYSFENCPLCTRTVSHSIIV